MFNKYLFNKYFQTKYLKKLEEKNFEQYQVFMYNFLRENDKIFIKISGLYKVFVWQNVSIHYKYYSVKITFTSFFSSSDMHNVFYEMFRDSKYLTEIVLERRNSKWKNFT